MGYGFESLYKEQAGKGNMLLGPTAVRLSQYMKKQKARSTSETLFKF